MADIVDTATRSRMMSGIRNKNTQPELFLRRALHRRGFRFRLHAGNLPGRPDLVFPARKAAILVHGCFWHAHDCDLFKLPETRREWWKAKIRGNRARDQRAAAALSAAGWRILTIWECAIKGKRSAHLEKLVGRIVRWLNGTSSRQAVIRGPAKRRRK